MHFFSSIFHLLQYRFSEILLSLPTFALFWEVFKKKNIKSRLFQNAQGKWNGKVKSTPMQITFDSMHSWFFFFPIMNILHEQLKRSLYTKFLSVNVHSNLNMHIITLMCC